MTLDDEVVDLVRKVLTVHGDVHAVGQAGPHAAVVGQANEQFKSGRAIGRPGIAESAALDQQAL